MKRGGQTPFMAPLPACRLRSGAPPFTHVGVDLFGPIDVVIFRRHVKRWVCVFTCFSTRAVCLEIVYTMETDSFISALTRFEAVRGVPASYHSDNGTNLIGAKRELAECLLDHLDGDKIVAELSRREVRWDPVPSAAPHFQGATERMVQSAKRALKYVLHLRAVNDETLHTAIKQVESLLNSRPLTYISADPCDPEPLTPSHLLLGRANPNLPPDVIGEEELSSKKRWRTAQAIATHFWRRWMREYLPGLTERRKWQRKERNLKVGDLVLLISPSNDRGTWPLGIVTEVCSGPDGVVRSAYVKTRVRPGEREVQTLHRPAVKLCLLEPDDAENVPDPVVHRAGNVTNRDDPSI